MVSFGAWIHLLLIVKGCSSTRPECVDSESHQCAVEASDANETADLRVSLLQSMKARNSGREGTSAADKCVDEPLWTNGRGRQSCEHEDWRWAYCIEKGWTCRAYLDKNWCKDGKVVAGNEWRMGAGNNYPEKGCCACGGGVHSTFKAGDKIWLPFPGNNVAVSEGKEVGRITGSLEDCEQACDKLKDCKSFAYCPGEQACSMKDKDHTDRSAGTANYWCSTYYKTTHTYQPADESLKRPSNAKLFEFYMYKVQDDQTYPPTNTNMGTLSGILWYLHNEVVPTCPRRFGITRFLRFKFKYRATQPMSNIGMNFGVRMAFDTAQCTGPRSKSPEDCPQVWNKYGFVIGCNYLSQPPYPACGGEGSQWMAEGDDYCPINFPGGAWYSVPGDCPQQNIWNKNDECKAKYPGGRCPKGVETPTGAGDCTYTFEDAGEIVLDELIGIKNHTEFCAAGCKEYDKKADHGWCTSWWDKRFDTGHNVWRTQQVDKAFKEKYPNMPSDADLPTPNCDFDLDRFGLKFNMG